MRKSRVLSFLLGLLIIVSAIIALIYRNNDTNNIYTYKVRINQWDNVYSGENIKFYFMYFGNCISIFRIWFLLSFYSIFLS